MINFTLSLALAGLTILSAPALAKPPSQTFEHAGERYIYTATTAKGRTVLRGYVERGFAPFNLSVYNGRVDGTVDGRSVSFRVEDVKRLNGVAEIAAR